MSRSVPKKAIPLSSLCLEEYPLNIHTVNQMITHRPKQNDDPDLSEETPQKERKRFSHLSHVTDVSSVPSQNIILGLFNAPSIPQIPAVSPLHRHARFYNDVSHLFRLFSGCGHPVVAMFEPQIRRGHTICRGSNPSVGVE
ncbi:hypothetical protein TNCV_2031181 [Trichonephila clavipes]|nr:hypothetical protein TNCV_2031181 [Trichonephila clavipes]